MKIKIILYSLLFSCFSTNLIYGQQVITISGGNATGSNGNMSYTIGQLFYNFNKGANSNELQGVQQPYEITVVTGIDKANNITLECSVYPNPGSGFIKLVLGNYLSQHIYYELTNINGELVDSKRIESSETSICLENLQSAIYFLKVFDNNSAIKTFKIIKK